MIALLERIIDEIPSGETRILKLETASSLGAIVWVAWEIGLSVARVLVENELSRRAKLPTEWPHCPHCGSRLNSKGFQKRSIVTLVGTVNWSRRVGRCPLKCQNSQRVPLDELLLIKPDQKTSDEVMRLGCLLAIFVPFGITSKLLKQLTGIKVCSQTIGNWIASKGRLTMEQTQKEIAAFEQGDNPRAESLSCDVEKMALALAADGVMVPFRPQEKTPSGATQWREVKVGVIARLGAYFTRSGKTATRLHQRRLIAVLGNINDLCPRLMLEAIRSGLHRASKVVWLSDGGVGFWNLYYQYLAPLNVIGVLDFYHAAGHLWSAAAAYKDGRTREAKNWFKQWRHQLRHGNSKEVILELEKVLEKGCLTPSQRQIIRRVHNYLKIHENHITYKSFEAEAIPRGSGMVESACKWLIQQRFKGVGMRWSSEGFNHLLHLRLAWVNGRFDNLFSDANFFSNSGPSPNS